jgi:hypothetical protein
MVGKRVISQRRGRLPPLSNLNQLLLSLDRGGREGEGSTGAFDCVSHFTEVVITYTVVIGSKLGRNNTRAGA